MRYALKRKYKLAGVVVLKDGTTEQYYTDFRGKWIRAISYIAR